MDAVEIEDARSAQNLVAEHFTVFDLGDFIPVLRPFNLQGYESCMRKVKDLQDKFVGEIVSEHRERKKVCKCRRQLQGHGGCAAGAHGNQGWHSNHGE